MTSEGYLPLTQPEGWAQVDFGEVRYDNGQGKLCGGYELVVSFPHSNYAPTQLLPAQNQECLFTGLQRIFEYIGVCPACGSTICPQQWCGY